MRIVKKLFNKILFAVVVAVVFAMINRCNVKASVLGNNLLSGFDYDIYRIEVDNLDDTWQFIGRTLSNSRSYPDYNFYINRNNKSLIGLALPNAQYLNVIEFYDFDINNYALYSNSSDSDPKLILTESNLMPVLGGNCQSGTDSYCFNFINSGFQGNRQSATIYGDTIYIDAFGVDSNNYVNEYSFDEDNNYDQLFYPYGKKMTCSDDIYGCNVGNASPSSQWGFYGQHNVNSVYFVSQKLKNNSQYEPVNQIVVEREQPVPTGPVATFTHNNIKVNNFVVGDNITIILSNFSPAYKYYIMTSDVDENYDESNFVELSEENFTHVEENGQYLEKYSKLYDQNGYLIFKIETSDGWEYETYVEPITEIGEQHPDIKITKNFQSTNGLTVDQILLNATYYIYKSDLTGYKCYYSYRSVSQGEPSQEDPLTYIETSCTGGRLYTANDNGTFYTKITYNDDTIYLKQVNVDEYGKLLAEVMPEYQDDSIFGKLLGGTNGLLSKFTRNNGPLASIVSLPLKLGIFINYFINSGTGVCSPYDMGTIFGQHLIIQCVDLSILGTTLLTTIDMIFAGFFTITWGKFLYSLFRKLVLLKSVNAIDMFKGGIF